MSIQKKSLINTLKSAKKANAVKEDVTVSGAVVSPFRPTAATKKLAVTKHLASKAAAVRNSAKKSAAMRSAAARQPKIVC